ncbi:hypothetical protein V6N12_058946 [Hibiscus sabdariffa]|uniref:FLZ-type domain-containing protein n=1 Tax=Hibiscus sabdariffa TaxID=183260 RepID=A0ABR2EVI4_9ROSI
MADHSSQTSPAAQDYTKRIPSFFHSPRFKAFTSKALPETEAIKSPTSILDSRPLFPFALNPPKSPKTFSPENPEPKGIGLAILDTRSEDSTSREPNNKKVLFGTELRVQIPPLPPTDFGIKTRNSHLSPTFGSPYSGIHMKDSPCISVTEMELSEDYTCVISHGPNPRTTHIFDNFIVENYCRVPDNKPKTTSQSFLSFCHACKKNLEQEIDIYIYRGEEAFCSPECRYQEMLLDGDGD